MNDNILHSKKFEKVVIGLLAIITVFFIFEIISIAWGFFQTNPASPVNTISVSGTGKVYAVADIAEFTFSVDETADTVADAQSKATDIGNKAIDYLKQQGIAATDIQASGYNVNPQYSDDTAVPCPAIYPSNCPPSTGGKLIGYEVTESVNVKVRDISKAGSILSGIGSIGVTNISGLSFTIDNDETLKEQAREAAITDAKAQAQKLASDLGVRLGKVTSYSENGNGQIYTPQAMAVGAVSSAASAPELPAGQNQIEVDVQVIYQIK